MTLWQNFEICLNPGFLVGPRKNYLQKLQGNLMQKSCPLGPTTWKVMQRNVWKDIANLRKRLNNYLKSQRHAWMTINSKTRKISQWENCLQSAHKLFSNVCIWLVLGDLTCYGLWINLLVRWRDGQKHVTNAWRVWSRTFIIHVSVDNTVMWETQHSNVNFDYFKTLIFACIFGSHTFVPISWTYKKQTSVSHSSTEAEIISLDAGLRMDRIPALTLWNLVIEIFHSAPSKIKQPKEKLRRDSLQATKPNAHNLIQFKHTNVFSSNTIHSGAGAILYVFEDNEAVL